MRRLIAVIRHALIGAVALILAACGAMPAQNGGTSQPAAPATNAQPATPATSKPAEVEKTEAPAETDLSPDVLYRLLTAEIAGQRGQIHTAVRQYLAAARESRDPAVAERATRIAVYARDDASALKAAELWAELQPQSIEAHQVAAAMYVRAGNTQKAHEQLEQIVADNKHSDRQTFMLITALLSKEKDKKVALQVMQELVATRQDNPDALYAYAQLALLVGDLDAAQKAAEQVRKLKPDWADTHILLSNILYRQGHKVEAMAKLKAAVDAYPDNTTLRDYYARRLVDEKRYKEAQEQFQALLEHAPNNHEAEYALGLLAMQLHDLNTAEEHFQHLVDIKNRVNEASYYLGQIAEQRDKQAKAIRLYEAVTDGQYQVDAQIRIALIEARLGKVEKARERLHDIQPESAELEQRLYLAEGEILTQAKRYQEAFDLYNEALVKMPDNLSLMYARALSAEKLDKIDIALEDLKKIVQADPNNVQALNAYGYTLVDRTDKVMEGYKYIQQAYSMQADDPAILDSMGWANYRLGKYPEAIKYLRKALETLKDPEIAAHLGEVLWVSGDHEQARDVWEAARRETPSHKMLLDVIKRFTQ
ncbi:MAG: tetratricopeptide repeat protein [Gammaproteobacteria bacterium]|nr:tetratricopeptide repeat protein [Gammaproteobacteria bacterium]